MASIAQRHTSLHSGVQWDGFAYETLLSDATVAARLRGALEYECWLWKEGTRAFSSRYRRLRSAGRAGGTTAAAALPEIDFDRYLMGSEVCR